MKATDLRHGDVLVYSWRKNSSISARLVRIITGNQATHCSVVVEVGDNKFILEQLGERMHSYLPFYYAMDGEQIRCMRPKFHPPDATFEEFNRKPYGYLCILDSLINHFIGLFSTVPPKARMSKWFKSSNLDCSILVGKVLKLDENASWCKSIEVLEPDDFVTHPDSFEYMGIVDDWSYETGDLLKVKN